MRDPHGHAGGVESRRAAHRPGADRDLRVARLSGEIGTPTTLEELSEHRAVNYVSARSGKTFPFEYQVDGEIVKVTLKSVLAVNDGSVYIGASALGHGIIQPSRFMVADLIAQGALKEILTTYTTPGTPLSILYAHRRNLSSRLRAFTEWVTELARNNPDLRITNT